MTLVVLLSVFIGLSLGLLGGGGSILTVPILVFAGGMQEHAAIATSLLVVGVTAAAALVPHARAGHVQWRTGLIFSGAGMVGAFGSGLVARQIPAKVLLSLFAILMVATAVAMLRKGTDPAPTQSGEARPIAKILLEGLVVGAVTGLVGAGGGFLVVPALVLLGGLPMRDAVGTSLLVIALKSLAGFAGHAAHVELDIPLTGAVVGAAVAGSAVGGLLATRLDASKLRKGFAYFVLAMAAFTLWRELPVEVRDRLLHGTWPSWLGGLAIGGVVLAFLYGTGQLLGVSTGYMDACQAVTGDGKARTSWRLPFLVGLVGGGALAAMVAGGWHPSLSIGAFDSVVGGHPLAKGALLVGGGTLVGFGARLAGGCTSGHSIVGVAQGARSSIVATIAFMVAGFAATWLFFGRLV